MTPCYTVVEFDTVDYGSYHRHVREDVAQGNLVVAAVHYYYYYYYVRTAAGVASYGVTGIDAGLYFLSSRVEGAVEPPLLQRYCSGTCLHGKECGVCN